ncbi:MAG TPA: hypothetical protein VHW67_05020 [Solirubrobacteraceae bacterium]|jgi:hypothetical protein|nr:hypothetical protein [Solirubrobacteraceae bacterium]
MTKQQRLEIDWTSADVQDGGDVTIELTGGISKAWRGRFEAVLGLLGAANGSWGAVKLTKKTISVQALQPQAEEDLRHFLESVVVQVNSELPEEQGDEGPEQKLDRKAILDAEMTATLRSFAGPRS